MKTIIAQIRNSIRENSSSFVADLVLVIFSLLYLSSFKQSNLVQGLSPERISVHFLIILTVVPWYSGYLLFHFDRFNKTLRRFLQWITGIIILSLVVFLVLLLFPILDANETPSSEQVFLISFGMFFIVLGPLMMIGGYSDHSFLDSNPVKGATISWPQLTLVMFIVVLSILFMILIIGQFDPHWEGKAGFGTVMLGFFGGPILAMICAIPFYLFGKWIEKIDQHRISIHSMRWLLPLLIFNSLIWWNDIVLNYLLNIWEITKPTASTLLLAVTLGGILPFRLLLLIKPPVSIFAILGGLFSIGLYLLSLFMSYNVY